MAAMHNRQKMIQINNIKNNSCTVMNSDNISNYIENRKIDCDEYLNEKKYIDYSISDAEGTSDIQEFYHGKNILITGGTGFLGKILVEKLLRCCPGVQGLYLMVRQKKGKDIYTRMEEIFNDPLFSRLKKEAPAFKGKVNLVAADCETAGLGLSLSDRQMLIEKVNVIFHSAATVKFDEQLRTALITNVCAPLYLLELAREMKGLAVLMHISTAYSNCHLPTVEERFYPCDSNLENLLSMTGKLSDEQIDKILPKILGPWPNTYTYTKALAEKEIRKNAGNVPVAIFRPAIVTSTVQEPLKGWLDNMYGPNGIAVGCCTGILRTVYCDVGVTADVVPVDFVVNSLMAAGKSVHTAYKQSPPPAEPPVYNYVSSVENRLTWGDFIKKTMSCVSGYPLSEAVWYISLTCTTSTLLNYINILFLHLLPGLLIDCLCVCLGRRPKMLKVYRKIHKFSSVLTYFCSREIVFCNQRTRELWEKTSEVDKKLFPFSMADLSWDSYLEEYIAGIRRYLFKESDDTLPRAKIKWKRLYYLHQIAKIFFFGLFLHFLWTTWSMLW